MMDYKASYPRSHGVVASHSQLENQRFGSISKYVFLMLRGPSSGTHYDFGFLYRVQHNAIQAMSYS